MVKLLLFRQFIAFLNFIEEFCNLIDLQTDDLFFMKLRHADKGSRVLLDLLIPEKIAVKAPERGDFPHESAFGVDDIITCLARMTFQVVDVFFQIGYRQFFEIRRCERMSRIIKSSRIRRL